LAGVSCVLVLLAHLFLLTQLLPGNTKYILKMTQNKNVDMLSFQFLYNMIDDIYFINPQGEISSLHLTHP